MKLIYGLLFAIVLPLLLAVWSMRMDSLLVLPQVASQSAGLAVAILGALIALLAVVDLRRFGHGWPMSPFPPERRASGGMYRLMNDPLYAGSVLICAGLSIALRSPAGIWLATPLLTFCCIAFVAGFEREGTERRYGVAERPPLLHLPAPGDVRADFSDRLAIYFIVLLPWLIAFFAVNAFGIPHDARSGWGRADAAVPTLPWTELIYFLDYPLVLAVPMLLDTRRQLRRFAIQGWLAIVIVTISYLVIPVIVVPKPAPDGSLFTMLMLWERKFDTPVTAFPAFHVIWAVIAANAMPRWRAFWWTLAIAISVSCATTGMHALRDLVAGAAVGLVIINAERIARGILRATERLANSWQEWDAGVVRAMSHGVYAAMGSFAGILLVVTLSGGMAAAAAAVAIATITGAALWAQFIEGSPMLLRPFGYYGGLLGASIAILLTGDPWRMLAAYAVASTIVVAFGRCRCLVQGCCHGRAIEEGLGIRYAHPRSRVTRLSDLASRSVHATQLYSIVWSLLCLVLLWRLWTANAPLQFIAGSSLILAGLGRFVEEHYRGEPQTRIVGGLRIYQWLAIVSVLAGAAVMAAGSTPAPAPVPLGGNGWLAASLVGIFTYVAYGVDFPRLNTRFARLV